MGNLLLANTALGLLNIGLMSVVLQSKNLTTRKTALGLQILTLVGQFVILGIMVLN